MIIGLPSNVRRVSCVVASCLLVVGFVMAPRAADAATNTFQLASYLDQPVTQRGQTFYSASFYIDRTGDNITVAGSADGTASFYVDDLLRVTVTHPDGVVLSTTIDDSNGCTADRVLTTPPTNIARYLRFGVNKVQVTFSDACGGAYGNSDIWIAGTAQFPPARPTLPAIDGGTYILVVNTNPALRHADGTFPAIECTSSFGVTAFGERSYALTAKHCFNQKEGDQSTNAFIRRYMPVDVRTSDSRYTFAQQLSCLAGTIACLLPANGAKPSADVVAFRPDTAQVTTNVQTGEGVLPVLGATTLEALPRGTRICHYGSGSDAQGDPQRCGSSQGYTTLRDPGHEVPAGLGRFSAAGFVGDSGGPAYVYARNSAGQPVGVYALGVVIFAARSGTIFIPIRRVEANLAVRILTGSPIR
jgi:hypothetical protein